MDISIIIVTKDRPRDLEECLSSIWKQSLFPIEVVIIDASREVHAEAVSRSWQSKAIELKHIQVRPDLGIERQRNLGIGNSIGQIVGFLDDDAIPDKQCLENVEAHFLADRDLGGVGAMNEEIFEIPWLKRLFWRIFMLPRFDGKGRIQPSGYPAFCNNPGSDAAEVECIPGVAAFLKREVLDQFQFNEDIPATSCMEDIDFSFRVGKRYKLIQSGQAKIYHKSSKQARSPVSVRAYMMIYYHGCFFSEYIEKSFLNRAALVWSRVGEILRVCHWALKERSFKPFRGVFKAYHHMLTGVKGK
jgi:GT2 family glycosyltransferase